MAVCVRDPLSGAIVHDACVDVSVSMTDKSHRLVVISYNLHGFNQGRHGLVELISTLDPDAIMVQEHWLTPDNLYKLSEISDKYFVFGSSAMNVCVSSGPLIGRPFRGTAIIINKKHICNSVNLISCDRFTAVKIANWLLISVYMPCTGTAQREFIHFASAAVAVASSHMTASSSTSWSRFSPPSNFVSGHMSTMWLMVCRWPQSQEDDWARPHLCKFARHRP